jgi:hypothetical protein
MQPTMSHHDPAQMSPEDRVAAVAEILATGLIRYRRKNREKLLALSRPDSAHGHERSENGGDRG